MIIMKIFFMKKIVRASSVVVIVIGVLLVVVGVWGTVFTYKNIAREKIVTPTDATIPKKDVRGPMTLKAQADIIRVHTLKMTDGKTFAEMPRQIPKLDEKGKPVLDKDVKPVMVDNSARAVWVTALTLTNALHFGILAYAFSALTALFGLFMMWAGAAVFLVSKR